MNQQKTKWKSEPFSFNELYEAYSIPKIEPNFLKANDGIDLAFYHSPVPKKAVASLIFIHGAGMHCASSSYQRIGYELTRDYNIESYFMDIRGHGNSGGSRGDTPKVEQAWDDAKLLLEYVRKKNGGLPVVLGGHSAGGGMTLNYATWKNRTEADGYIIVAPYLGYKSDACRYSLFNDTFSRSNLFHFVVYVLTFKKLFAHQKSVIYNYTDEQLANDALMNNSVTCHTAFSITLWNPIKQFSSLSKPLGLFIGREDELFDPDKVVRYSRYIKKENSLRSEVSILDGQKHLSILVGISKNIGQFITQKIIKDL